MSFKVLGIGEVLWDLLPGGPQLGGAPANFACHAQALGARGGAITRIGNDPLGHEILERFRNKGLSETSVQIDARYPTGTVSVALSETGVPQFTIHENVAWDHLSASAEAMAKVQNAHAICFGSLAQRNPISRAAILQLVASAPRNALKIFDVNLRQDFYSAEIIEQSLEAATIFKLNDAELPVIGGMFAPGESPEIQIEKLADRFNLDLVALTKGSEGSSLYQEGRWSHQLPIPVSIADTVGAGDSFTAALTIGLLHGMDLDEVHGIAAEVAAYVCSQAGATPPLPVHLTRKFTSQTK